MYVWRIAEFPIHMGRVYQEGDRELGLLGLRSLRH